MLKTYVSVVMALGAAAIFALAGCKSEEDFRMERANYARLHFERSQFKELPQDVRLTLPECIRLAHENNLDVNRKELTVKAALVSPGPIIKRFRAKARGSAGRIRKRTSHLEIILTDN